MKIIKPNAEEFKQEHGLEGMLKHIERCGRLCYKSEDKITNDSYIKFVNMLKSKNHGAMLEHGTVYLTIPDEDIFEANDKCRELQVVSGMWGRLASIVREPLPYSKTTFTRGFVHITTNYRVIIENNLEWLMEKYQILEPTENHYKRRTFHITCNRSISHEFVRHRVFSFAQESQRYCNYSKDKYGNEIKFIEPKALQSLKDECSMNYAIWYEACARAESDYLGMLSYGATPQEARDVLPNATATELIMTGFEGDWEHFFELRCAKDAHPQAQEVANMIREQF